MSIGSNRASARSNSTATPFAFSSHLRAASNMARPYKQNPILSTANQHFIVDKQPPTPAEGGRQSETPDGVGNFPISTARRRGQRRRRRFFRVAKKVRSTFDAAEHGATHPTLAGPRARTPEPRSPARGFY